MTNDFYFLPLFSLENLKIFHWRVIQHNSFSGLTFTDWQRGRIRFKWKTPKFFRGAFSPTVLLIYSLCEKKVKSKVKPVLVHFVRRSFDILEFTLGNTVR